MDLLESSPASLLGNPDCTPGYYNNEGQPMDAGDRFGMAGYPLGPVAFFEYIDEWRNSRRLRGPRATRLNIFEVRNSAFDSAVEPSPTAIRQRPGLFWNARAPFLRFAFFVELFAGASSGSCRLRRFPRRDRSSLFSERCRVFFGMFAIDRRFRAPACAFLAFRLGCCDLLLGRHCYLPDRALEFGLVIFDRPLMFLSRASL